MKILKNHFAEQIKIVSSKIFNFSSLLISLSIAAIIVVLIGRLTKYSPQTLLIVDIIFFIFVKKFVDEYHNLTKTKYFWTWSMLFITVFAVFMSVAVALQYYWAIINVVVIVFLFYFSLIFFNDRIQEKSLIKNNESSPLH